MALKILITGGTGFIGRNLKEQLYDNYSIYAPTRTELNLLDEGRVFEYLKQNHFDVIIYTANYDAAPKFSKNDPSKVLENNLKMFFNIARCQDCFKKMIYFGSGAEFGREYWIPKMKEDYFDQHVPVDQYGFSKYIMTNYVQLSSNMYNLRLFGVFGKYDDWRYRFISNACCKAVLNLPIVINQSQAFDFLYIEDLIRIVKWFIDNKPQKQVYNVCSGQSFDFKALAKKILKISGKRLEIIIKNESLGREYSGDNTLLMNELKACIFTPIDDAIKALYHWYDSNKHSLDKDNFHY